MGSLFSPPFFCQELILTPTCIPVVFVVLLSINLKFLYSVFLFILLLLDSVIIRIWATEKFSIFLEAHHCTEQDGPCKSLPTEGIGFSLISFSTASILEDIITC